MKFVDANVFLRHVVEPRTEADVRMNRLAATFFRAVEAGEIQATTSEVVIHEIFYVLCSRREYDMSHEEAVSLVEPLLSLRALHLAQRRVIMRAVDIFLAHEILDFSDALSVAYCEAEGHELISFDRGIDRVPGASRSEP